MNRPSHHPMSPPQLPMPNPPPDCEWERRISRACSIMARRLARVSEEAAGCGRCSCSLPLSDMQFLSMPSCAERQLARADKDQNGNTHSYYRPMDEISCTCCQCLSNDLKVSWSCYWLSEAKMGSGVYVRRSIPYNFNKCHNDA